MSQAEEKVRLHAKSAPDYRRSHLPTYQEVLAEDPRAPHPVFREYSEVDIPMGTVPRERYVSKAFFDLEVERMWTRVWQLACREEQIPEVGDYLVYESPGASILIVRSGPTEIKAYYNSCRHRGMRLCAGQSSVSQIRCPYHGFTWSLDGTIARIPKEWDFSHLRKEALRLTEVRVGRWGGFVFINRDVDAQPLETYLANLPAHFADWPRDDVYLAVNVRKVLKANWKACIEGFIEGFHVPEMHPQAKPFSGETCTQYDVWPGNENISRFVGPLGFPSEENPEPMSEEQVYDALMRTTGLTEFPPLPPNTRARTAVAAAVRRMMSEMDGRDYSGLSDAEVVDAAQYSIFPNIVLFRSLGFPYLYRFIPLEGDPHNTLFDFMIFRPKPLDGSPVPEAQYIDLGPDDTFTDCGVFPSWLGLIYDQDARGLAMQQEGLRSGAPDDLILSRYQEVRIRHLHQTLTRYVSQPPT